MKRTLSLAFALALAATLAACDRPAGNAGSGATSDSGSSATRSSGSAASGGTASRPAEPKRTPSGPAGSSSSSGK